MKQDSKNKLALAYARAWFAAAGEAKREEEVWQDVKRLAAALAEDGRIIGMLRNPLWKVEAKKEAACEIGQKLELAEVSTHALETAAENNRLSLLPEILSAYERIYYEEADIVEVRVSTAMPLSAEQGSRLIAALEKRLGKKVVVKYKIAPEILGGLLVEYGSAMFDDSLKGKLTKLELLMTGTK